MSCKSTRIALLELQPDELKHLPHLAECAACQSLADALTDRLLDLDRALDHGADPPSSLITPTPANRPWRFTMSTLALAAAALVTLVVGSRPQGVPATTPAANVTCAIDTALESRALVGKLTPDEIHCLEAEFARSPTSLANRVLMVNAWSADDMEAWEHAGWRQLRSDHSTGRVDPDVGYKLALHHAKVGEHELVVEAVELTLPRVNVWAGDTVVKRTSSLLKVRAAAHHAMLAEVLQQGADATAARATALASARAWLSHQRKHGADAVPAEDLCKSLASNPADCAP
jgi:hypothetical protein